MISNPGTGPVSTLMDKSIYDVNNKNQDIFAYTDSKTADKVTLSQVASQISSATSSFVTSSVVDQKIANAGHISSNDPNIWHTVTLVPIGNFSSYTTLSSIANDGAGYYYCKLPITIDVTNNVYEFVLDVYGLMRYGTVYTDSTQALPYVMFKIGNTAGNVNNYKQLVRFSCTNCPKKTTTTVSPMDYAYALGTIAYGNAISMKFGCVGTMPTGSTMYTNGDALSQNGQTLGTETTFNYIGINFSSYKTDMTSSGIVFKYRKIPKVSGGVQ